MKSKRSLGAERYTVWMRNYQRARVRAMTRLAKAHPDEYKELFEEEKMNDYTQGKTWIDIDGNTSASVDTDTSTNTYKSKSEKKRIDIESGTGNL